MFHRNLHSRANKKLAYQLALGEIENDFLSYVLS